MTSANLNVCPGTGKSGGGGGDGKGEGPTDEGEPTLPQICHHLILEMLHVLILFQGGRLRGHHWSKWKQTAAPSLTPRTSGLKLQQLHTLEEQEVCVKKQEVVNIAVTVTNSLSQFTKLLCKIILADLIDPDQPCGGLGHFCCSAAAGRLTHERTHQNKGSFSLRKLLPLVLDLFWV